MARPEVRQSEQNAVVRAAARANERDLYLAALLAPRPARQDLIALAAFLGEAERAAAAVSEPVMGEIRLQWWSDALTSRDADGATGSPIADAMRAAIARHALPRELLLSILNAYSRALNPQFPQSMRDLEGYFDATDGAAFRLAARILSAGDAAAANEALAAAGQAYGRVRLLRSLPAALAKGRSPLPPSPPAPQGSDDWDKVARPLLVSTHSWLECARLKASAAPKAVFPALLPLALVEPYLAALERLGPNIARERAEISPLTRVWRLWRTSARGHL